MNGIGRPVTGISPMVIADVLEHLPQHHREHAGTDVGAQHVLRQVGDAPDPQQQQGEQADQTPQPSRPNCSPIAENGKSAHCTGMSFLALVIGPSSHPCR